MYIETRGYVSISSIDALKNYLETRGINFNNIEDNIYIDIDAKILVDLYNYGFLNEHELSESIKKCNVLEFYEG
jgi:hypothetical protein